MGIYNSCDKPLKVFPELPIHLFGNCTLVSSICVYCIGGARTNKSGLDSVHTNVWKMNMRDRNSKWKEIGSLNQKRKFMSCAVFRETLVVAGGSGEIRVVN